MEKIISQDGKTALDTNRLNTDSLFLFTQEFSYNKKRECIKYENESETRTYRYDRRGNLIAINIETKPGVMSCGLRTTGWTCEYNKKNQLTQSTTFQTPWDVTSVFRYSKNKIVCEFLEDRFGHSKTVYTLREDRLIEKKETFDENREVFGTVDYRYAFY